MFVSRLASKLFSTSVQRPITNISTPMKENLFNHVSYLSSLQRHVNNINGLNQAGDYIRSQWNNMGLKVTEQKFEGPSGDSNEYKNLIVSFGPQNAPRIILGAHYDSEAESLTPGADDNASGIAGIIEISRLLKEKNPRLTKRIDVVAYTTEERPHCALDNGELVKHVPYMGSYVHAKSLKKENVPVVGAIILEMIGYFSDLENSQEYPSKLLKLFYPVTGDFIGVVGNLNSFDFIQKVKSSLKKHSSIDVRSISIPRIIIPDISRSDHDSYYAHGYKALMVTDTADFRNPNYHKSTDTPDTLSYEKMAEIVKGVYGTLISL
ncbi:MAG: M28 family peptidase [Candidatus Melainabacteria bacterium]|nr:M28 family peptidase [Candidatus Melainabacteria bacterium]